MTHLRPRIAFHAVRRAAADLAAGMPVLLAGEGGTAIGSVILAVETATHGALEEFALLAASPPVLLLAAARGAALLGRAEEPGAGVVGLGLGANPLEPELLLRLADPTAGEPLLSGALAPAPLPEAAAAALALAKQARLLPAVLASPAQPEAAEVAARRQVLTVTAADVLACAESAPFHLQRVSEAQVPLEAAADTRIIAFRVRETGVEHLAILIGRPEAREAPLVRVHSECFTGDLLGSLRCDCGAQLRGAMARIAAEGAGALLYLAQEGRGIGLMNKIRAYRLQERGLDTVDANRALGWGKDERNHGLAARILGDLGLKTVRLLTNNPEKLSRLRALGVEIVERVPLVYPPNGVNNSYLETKAARLGHLLV